MESPARQPDPPVGRPARSRFGRPRTHLPAILVGLAVVFAAVRVRADDPPPKPTPGQQRVMELLAQFIPGAHPQARSTQGDGAFDPTLAADPLDSSSVSITDAGLIEVHVRDTDITTVLEMLSYQARSNIVASKSVHGTVSANLYGLTLSEALDAILTPNQYAYRQMGKTIFVGTPDEISAQLPPPETRILKLRYITKTEALTAVNTLLSPDGSAVIGGGESKDGTSGSKTTDLGQATEVSVDYLIVTDTAPHLDAIERLLEQIDVRPKQVLIEATILRATLNENNEFGIDFTLLGGMDFQNVSSQSVTSTNITTGNTPPERFEKTTFNVNTDLIGQFPEGGFSFGIIRNSVATFVRALEEVTDVAVVANPKIIALNKQQAEVIVGRRDGYLTTTVTETAAIQTVEFLETGTQIRFCPFINEDGTVRLAVHPKDSNGGLTSANLPFEETTEAQASILVEDGHTVLIGGLFRERTVSSRGQVPLLGDIPGAGLLFQRNSGQTVREEVVILLTVHILKDTSEEQERFASLLEDVERIRVGSRRGLLGSGRERLAQAFYQEAIRQVEQGHTGRALLNVRMALHNHPKHLSAIKLKERLLGQRMWDNEGSRSRLFLLDLIRQEQAPPEEVDQSGFFGRPPLDLQIQRDEATEETVGTVGSVEETAETESEYAEETP
jgi:type IV pilus assembly protein PilQ